MSRSFKDFQDAKRDRVKNKRKNLRHNGREAYKYFSGAYEDEDSGYNWAPKSNEKSSIYGYKSVGRGSSGESSN
jgi:hypothetical protein